MALSEAAKVEALRSHALQFLGQTYDALGRKEDALAVYQQGAATGSSAFLSETAARRLLEMGRSEAALEMLEVEMARHPQVAILPVLASRALLQLGQVDAARVAADRAITLDPTLGDAFYQRGVVAIAQRDGAAALPDLIQAAALDRRHLGARKALAMLRYAQGDLPEAQRLLEEVLTIDPKDPDARADLATIASEARGAGR